jgi:AAA ATPase-like protein
VVEGLVQITARGSLPVKGLPHPIEVFELVDAGPTRKRLQAAAARGLTPFVGRQTELAALHRALEQARTGHGQVVAVVGEPGMGKSRLFWECTHAERMPGWLILESGSASYDEATAYLPVVDLLRTYFQIETQDDGPRSREKHTGKLLMLDKALAPTLPAFLALLGVPV